MHVMKSNAIPNERPKTMLMIPIIGVSKVITKTARPAVSSCFGYDFASVPFSLNSTNDVTVSNE